MHVLNSVVKSTRSPVRADRPVGLRRPIPSILTVTLASFVLFASTLIGGGSASADTRPEPPENIPTVSADSLPTAQINGVAWAQIVVGDTVYVAGDFSSARPAGAPERTEEVPRANILAYDITTGVLKADWAPTLNAPGLGLAASPDGARIYVVGNFTRVSGKTRYRVAALDAVTGEVIDSFAPVLNYRVRTVAVTGDSVYLGGGFTTANGQVRNRLAAYNATTGTLLDWAPSADQEVMALTIPTEHPELVVGGRFVTLGGEPARGMGALDLDSGTPVPWAANETVINYGVDGAIYSLSNDGANVYGTGYGFLHGNPDSSANLEHSFAASADGGSLIWLNGCKGDTYSSWPQDGVLYTVGHPHNCSFVGGHPQTLPWTYQRAMATTTTVGPDGQVNVGGAFTGLPAPQVLHWQPSLTYGTYTGQSQAAWSVSGDSRYIVLGGEFPTVNGTSQQGLARFPVASIAPNREGAQNASQMAPAVFAQAPGKVRVSWRTAWDRDNSELTYQVLRGRSAGSAVPIATVRQPSDWWYRPQVLTVDADAAAGTTQTYRIKVTDPLGNTTSSVPVTYTVPESIPPSTYRDTVVADGATHLWRLGEATGGLANDWAGGEDLVVSPDEIRGTPGGLPGEPEAMSTTFKQPPPPDPTEPKPPSPKVPATTSAQSVGPQTFAVEAWFKTTSTIGGKIIGFGDNAIRNSSLFDRHIYMSREGLLTFGVNGNGQHTATSARAYNDGSWHHAVGSLGDDGIQLYVDGKLVAADADAVGALVNRGFWRVGGDNLLGWPNKPNQYRFIGSIQDVAVYGGPLTADQVLAHYQASGSTPAPPAVSPTDRYGAAVVASAPGIFWRLDDTAGPAVDAVTGLATGAYTSGVTRGQPPSPAGAAGTSIRLSGTSDEGVASTLGVRNPTTFSTEIWFRSASTSGGRLIGFGNAVTGRSTWFDRFVQLLDDGTLRYGINFEGEAATIDSPPGFNDGAWHQVVATQSPQTGMTLYVDGQPVADLSTATAPEVYSGYWRVGADSTWGDSTSEQLDGDVDEASVYPVALSAADVAAHYEAATAPVEGPAGKAAARSAPPTDSPTPSIHPSKLP